MFCLFFDDVTYMYIQYCVQISHGNAPSRTNMHRNQQSVWPRSTWALEVRGEDRYYYNERMRPHGLRNGSPFIIINNETSVAAPGPRSSFCFLCLNLARYGQYMDTSNILLKGRHEHCLSHEDYYALYFI